MRKSWNRSADRRGLHSWDAGILEYLVFISDKHDVDPYELLDSLFEAGKKGVDTCGPLKIVLREKEKNHVIFLIKKESEIVSQIRFRNEVWKNSAKTKRLYSRLVDNFRSFRRPPKTPSSIKEMQKGMKNVDLKAKVTGKSEVTWKHSRYDGSPLRFCIATLTDSTGSIRLPLWNNQIESISVGDEIEIKKAYVTAFEGILQIVPSRKKGKLNVVKPSVPAKAPTK